MVPENLHSGNFFFNSIYSQLKCCLHVEEMAKGVEKAKFTDVCADMVSANSFCMDQQSAHFFISSCSFVHQPSGANSHLLIHILNVIYSDFH